MFWLVILLASHVEGDYVKDITGLGITDGALAMYDADLGIARWDASRNATALMFGDNFEFKYMQGEWRSPSIIMYDQYYNPIGIPTANNGVSKQRAVQLWPYQHNNPEYSTILPCDFIKIGDTWYVAVMVTKGLCELCQLRTEFWRSNDLVSWSGPVLTLYHPSHPGNVMLTFDIIDSYVYIFGTGGLARNKPIWMWRNPVNQFPLGLWEPWGFDGNIWDWGIPNENTASSIDYADGFFTPQLYGGYISPDSVLGVPNGMKFFVSQWITSTNDPYKVMLFQDTLQPWIAG